MKNSVQSAILSTLNKVRLYQKTPKNGLVIFCGRVLMEDGRTEKMINYDIVPFKPLN